MVTDSVTLNQLSDLKTQFPLNHSQLTQFPLNPFSEMGPRSGCGGPSKTN